MENKISMRICLSVNETEEDLKSNFTGVEYLIFVSEDGKFSIPVSFKGFTVDIENNSITFNTGYGLLENDFELEDIYDDELADLGLSRENLTPEFLSNCTLVQMGIGSDILTEDSLESMKLEELKIVDMNTEKKYDMSDKISKDFLFEIYGD